MHVTLQLLIEIGIAIIYILNSFAGKLENFEFLMEWKAEVQELSIHFIDKTAAHLNKS